jgi:hypothetical protein
MRAEDELLQRVASQLEQDAPPISIDEIEQRALTAPLPLDGTRTATKPLRWTPIVVAVAAAALVTGGFALALTSRSPAPTLRTSGTAVLDSAVPPTQPRPGPATTIPASTMPSEPQPTVAAPTTVAAGSSDISLDGDAAAVIAAIDADRIDKLRMLTGFTATVRQTTDTLGDDGQSIDSQPGVDSRTTLLANGSMWTDIDGGGFASYDATTGESRGAIVMPSGEMYYQLIEGWTENSTGMSIMLGHDPARLLSDIGAPGSVTVEATDFDGRPAWMVKTTYSPIMGEPDGSGEQIETFTVDQATGLMVASSIESGARPGEISRRVSELFDLEVTDEMPSAFPGEFPEDAQIDRSGDPTAFRPTTLSEAAEWFGPGFVSPPEVPAGTTIFLTEFEWEEGNPQAARSKTVEIRAREGFATPWRISIFKDEPGSDGAVPDGYLLVDGSLCVDFDDDGICGVGPPTESDSIDNDALAGFSLHGEPPSLMLERGGVRIGITGSPLADGWSLAETFVVW